MKILLDSKNSSIVNIVNICVERSNADLINEDGEYDLLICDYDADEEKEFDFDKTLFLLAKGQELSGAKYKLTKPFLPTDLINFIVSFGSKKDDNLQNSEIQTSEIQAKNLAEPDIIQPQNESEEPIIMEKMHEKLNKDIQEVSSLIKEIDEMDTKNMENTEQKIEILTPKADIKAAAPQDKNVAKGDEVSTENIILENFINDFYKSNDNRPISEVASDLNNLVKRGFFEPSEFDIDYKINSIYKSDDDRPISDIAKEIELIQTEVEVKEKIDNADIKASKNDMNFDINSNDDRPISEIAKEIESLEKIKIDDFEAGLDLALGKKKDEIPNKKDEILSKEAESKDVLKTDRSDTKLVNVLKIDNLQKNAQETEISNNDETELEAEDVENIIKFENFPSNLDENTIRKNLKNAILAELKKINAKISSFKLKVKF